MFKHRFCRFRVCLGGRWDLVVVGWTGFGRGFGRVVEVGGGFGCFVVGAGGGCWRRFERGGGR